MFEIRDFSGKALLAAGLTLAAAAPLNAAQANDERVLYSFTGGNDGYDPQGVISDPATGNLYGVTTNGGGSPNCTGGCGTVFKLAPDGTLTTLHVFNSGSDDGAYPKSPLIRDMASGDLYGVTQNGGGSSNCNLGCGTVFKLTPDGNITVLHAFTDGSDGGNPYGRLIRDNHDNFYGVVAYDGAGGHGLVYKLRHNGKFIVLHAFTGGSDGANPFNGLTRGDGGNLYGVTTYGGGACNCGTVFKIAPDGAETILHAFGGGPDDGAGPGGRLAKDRLGNFYGTTYSGGPNGCGYATCGALFKIAADGSYSILHFFTGGSDGAGPLSDLVVTRRGTVFGTTFYGASANSGTVFKIKSTGTMTVLYSFLGQPDGQAPQTALARDHGNLYGTTQYGGTSGYGTVFTVTKK